MVQVAVQLPALDAESLTQDYDQACLWIDLLWAACLDRCTALRHSYLSLTAWLLTQQEWQCSAHR